MAHFYLAVMQEINNVGESYKVELVTNVETIMAQIPRYGSGTIAIPVTSMHLCIYEILLLCTASMKASKLKHTSELPPILPDGKFADIKKKYFADVNKYVVPQL